MLGEMLEKRLKRQLRDVLAEMRLAGGRRSDLVDEARGYRRELRRLMQARRRGRPGIPGTRRNTGPRTIDITPKWSGLMRWIMRVLEDPGAPEKAKAPLREELMRLARWADEMNVKAGTRPLFNRRRR